MGAPLEFDPGLRAWRETKNPVMRNIVLDKGFVQGVILVVKRPE